MVKGAPDVLIALLASSNGAGEIERVVGDWAEHGLRVLLVARRAELEQGEDPERRLEPVGLVGLADTPRATARASVEHARAAGVRTMMITGDHPRTAASVAAATGIAAHEDRPEVLTGRELDALSADALRDAVRRVDVFARVVPEHKVRIVEALKDDGEIAAMTGDGVNDVPALKAAHIGVAMGRRGTDGRQRGRRHGAGRRRLLDDRARGPPGPGDPRQHRPLRPLPVRGQRRRGARLRARGAARASARRSRCCRSCSSTCCSTGFPPPRSGSIRPTAR